MYAQELQVFKFILILIKIRQFGFTENIFFSSYEISN